jgi:hypothetical protein
MYLLVASVTQGGRCQFVLFSTAKARQQAEVMREVAPTDQRQATLKLVEDFDE